MVYCVHANKNPYSEKQVDFRGRLQVYYINNGYKDSILIGKSHFKDIHNNTSNSHQTFKVTLEIESKETAILLIPSFSLKRYMECDSIFMLIKRNDIENLIIDVRGNSGGFGWKVDSRTSFLTDRSYACYDSGYSKFGFMNSSWVTEDIRSGKYEQIGNYVYYPGDIIKPERHLNCFNGSIYVLIEANSYSGAIVFANNIQCYSLGIIVGEETN